MQAYNERIDKILAASGRLSRSEAKSAAKSGMITVNGKRVFDCSVKVTERDILCLDGEEIVYSKYIYILLNKPEGYVCSTDNRDGLPVMSIFGDRFGSHKVSPVGRLDKNTTGALLLTDDGVLGHMLLSPSKHVDKVYRCTCISEITDDYISTFAAGVNIGEVRPTLPAQLVITGSNTALLTLHEGKFHQVKRMFEAMGNKITALHRQSFASLTSDGLDTGEWRFLTSAEIEQLFGFCGKTVQ